LRIKLLFCAFLLLFGCGKKTSLIVFDDTQPKPELINLSSQISEQMLQLKLGVTGGNGAVSYQIDRAEIDAGCQCMHQWFRYYESSPSSKRVGLERNIKIRHSDIAYAFRVRVMDSLARSSDWSKVIRLKASGGQEVKANHE